VPGPWVTLAELKGRLAALLQLDGGPAALASFWDGLLLQAQQSAYNAIVSILVGRGFALAQLDAWLAREGYESDITMAFCLRDPPASDAGDLPRLEGKEGDYELPEDAAVTLRHLDRRAELYTLTLVDAAGALIVPGWLAVPRWVGAGRLAEAEDWLPLGTPTRRPWPDQLEVRPRTSGRTWE
jgi:hypothetical protein